MLPGKRDSGGCSRDEPAPVKLKFNVTVSMESAANQHISARHGKGRCRSHGESDLDSGLFKIVPSLVQESPRGTPTHPFLPSISYDKSECRKPRPRISTARLLSRWYCRLCLNLQAIGVVIIKLARGRASAEPKGLEASGNCEDEASH